MPERSALMLKKIKYDNDFGYIPPKDWDPWLRFLVIYF